MANRVTTDEVNDIIETGQKDLTSFIETANLLVDENLVGKGMSDALLKQVELYLAAHFAAINIERGGLMKSKLGDSEDTYSRADFKGSGLGLTRYGQQAIAMDNSGILGTMSASGSARFTVL